MGAWDDLKHLFLFLSQFSRTIKGVKGQITIIVVMGAIAGFSSTALLALINHALHQGTQADPIVLAAFIGCCLLLPVARFSSSYLLERLVQQGVHDLQLMLSRCILSQPLLVLERIEEPRLLATLTDDIRTITEASSHLPVLCMHLALVIGSLIYLCWLSWPLSLFVLCFIAVGGLSYQVPMLRAMHFFRKSRETRDDLFKGFRALLVGIKELKIHCGRREAFFATVLKPISGKLLRQHLAGSAITAATSSWGLVLFFVLVGFVVFIFPQWWAVDTESLSGYALVILFLMGPLEILLGSFSHLGPAAVSVRKIQEVGDIIEDLPDEAPTPLAPEEPIREWHRIDLCGVTHTYLDAQHRHFTLGPIDLVIRRGELIFLCGGNGSGKTTLMKLLLSLYNPEKGQILVDGEPVTVATRDAYCRQFSVVFSDFFLFDSLHGLDNPELDMQAHTYLLKLNLGMVKIEQGHLSTTKLSQGQRKRLALLTAYLENRSIYVFDEWAADQDPSFKEVFYYQILPELKQQGKAVIAISHDDRYYHVADRLVKLEDGQICYDGHPETVARSMESRRNDTLEGSKKPFGK